jgi:hypothetical protein
MCLWRANPGVLKLRTPCAPHGDLAFFTAPQQDPCKAAPGQRGAPAPSVPLHLATAIARCPCRLLFVPAADLRRFGRRLRAPLAEAARARREFIERRRALLRGTRSGLAATAAELGDRMAGGDGRLAAAGMAADAFRPRAGAACTPPAAGLGPKGGGGGAAAAAALTAWDLRSLRQLVPPVAPPCLVDIAASGRPFPEALLTATAQQAPAAAAAPAPPPQGPLTPAQPAAGPQVDGGGAPLPGGGPAPAGTQGWNLGSARAAAAASTAESSPRARCAWEHTKWGHAEWAGGSRALPTADGAGDVDDALTPAVKGAALPAAAAPAVPGPCAHAPAAAVLSAPPQQQPWRRRPAGGPVAPIAPAAAARRMALGGGFVTAHAAKRLADVGASHGALLQQLRAMQMRQQGQPSRSP